jgi:hypothetical protein
VPATRRVVALSSAAALAVAVSALLPVSASAQKKGRPDPDGPDPKVGLTIALQVGTGRYDFTGQGVCLQIPDGEIFDAPAALYSVRQTGDRQRLNMTLYRLKKGSDMVTINVTIGSTTHSVSTVKVGTNGVPLGSGTAKLDTAGAGGTLTIDATDAKGTKITGTIKCETFNRPLASNGQ